MVTMNTATNLRINSGNPEKKNLLAKSHWVRQETTYIWGLPFLHININKKRCN
jgi:hypothetical protein